MLTTSVRLTGRKLSQGSSPRTSSRREPSSEPGLSPEISACLGERLRASYTDLMRDPMPDQIARLLKALDDRERNE